MTTTSLGPVLRAGDHVLVGARGEAMPQDWRMGRVVVAHGDNVVVEMEDDAHRRVRLIAPADVIVISRGETWLRSLTVARQMLELKLGPEIAEVLACERRLAAARDAFWAGIDGALGVRAPVIDGPGAIHAASERCRP